MLKARGSGDSWAVIFDCDGVVVDSEPLSLMSLQEVVRRYQLPLSQTDLDQYCGHSDQATYDDLVAKHRLGCSFEDFMATFNAVYAERLTHEGLRRFPGVGELVVALQRGAVPYGMGTAAMRAKVDTSLAAVGMARAFPVIVTADDVARAKPAPDIFLEVARRLGVPAERCVVIEDSPTGVQAAHSAGMACVAVTNTYPSIMLSSADHVVGSLLELAVPMLYDLVRRHRVVDG